MVVTRRPRPRICVNLCWQLARNETISSTTWLPTTTTTFRVAHASRTPTGRRRPGSPNDSTTSTDSESPTSRRISLKSQSNWRLLLISVHQTALLFVSESWQNTRIAVKPILLKRGIFGTLLDCPSTYTLKLNSFWRHLKTHRFQNQAAFRIQIHAAANCSHPIHYVTNGSL